MTAVAGIDRHYGHAGPAFVRALVADGVHRHPERLREQVLSAARKLAGDKAGATHVRAATPFALLLIAGELAKAARLLPQDTGVAEAIGWAWTRFTASSDALALEPAEQAITNLQQWLLERWDVTVKGVAATGPQVDGRWHLNSRETLAWYDEAAVYIPATRMGEACGGTLKPEALARILSERGLLVRRKDTRRLTVGYVPKVGYGSWYALSRTAFGRSTAAAAPTFTVHEGGRL